MQQHLAGHLEIIALLSLPSLDDIDDNSEAGKVASNEANRNYADSKADDFDRTVPLVLRDDDQSEGTPLAMRQDTELFELSLKTESNSFESRNGATIETREVYSKEIVGNWLSEIPYQERGIAGDWPPVPVDHHESSDPSESSDSSEATDRDIAGSFPTNLIFKRGSVHFVKSGEKSYQINSQALTLRIHDR